jgi:hypothetical protein
MMLPMTATLNAGSELTVIGTSRTGARRFKAIVADIAADRIVFDSLIDDLVAAAGSTASFLHDGRVYDCSVVHGTGSQLTVTRPHDLVADDRRRVRRVATSLPAAMRRSARNSEVQAARVIDLSLSGAKLLVEHLDDTLGLDHELELRLGPISTRAWVRHIEAHASSRLRYIGVEFAPMNDVSRGHLLKTVGSLRAGIHVWR